MLKNPQQKYTAFAPIQQMANKRTWPSKVILTAPIWCSSDLRDGNQSLIEPMNLERKMRMFNQLLEIGFKEIEIGFPSASQIEFDFVRKLISENLIPDDVYIQVLTQARTHLIERTFEALAGAKKAIVHVYNSTAPVMRKKVFALDDDGIIEIATKHAKQILDLSKKYPQTKWRFEYSPEMFSNTELDFSLKICDAVVDSFEATSTNKLILNLPTTVECSTPNIFADQIEYIHNHLKKRECVILSVHPHNDRGTGTASAELALMAGAERVEGCLFGNGERTGNVDLINLALNLYTQGIQPNLNINNIDNIRSTVEYCNQIPIHPRHPYVGDLVYTSFSGSHQDAIKKVLSLYKENDKWDIPYLPLDPKDLGRSYEAIIRVNSQSGKGGISFLLEKEYGIELPRRLQIEFSQIVQAYMDENNQELEAEHLWDIFKKTYLQTQGLSYQNHKLIEDSFKKHPVSINVDLLNLYALNINYKEINLKGEGNGPIDAFIQGICTHFKCELEFRNYHEHAMGAGADAKAVSYIEMGYQGKSLFGVGIHENILTASILAILSAVNRFQILTIN
jgi:2-isopropylmalate synthase